MKDSEEERTEASSNEVSVESGAVSPGAPEAEGSGWVAFFRRWGVLRDHPGRLEALLLGLACIGLLLVVWQILTMGEGDARIVDAYTLPSPKETIETFPSLWFDRALTLSAVASLSRVLGGFAMAIAIAVPLGIIAGSYGRVAAFFRPISVFGRNVPIAALIPLTLMWFGIGELNKVMFIFLAAAAFVLFDSTSAVQAVPVRYMDTAYTLGARPQGRRVIGKAVLAGLVYALLFSIGWWVMRTADASGSFASMAEGGGGGVSMEGFEGMGYVAVAGLVIGTALWFPILNHQAINRVLMPLAMPDIVNSLRLLFGLAFGYIMLAEVINAKRGLGAIIVMSQRQGPREHIYLCLIIISLLAFGIDRLILWTQRKAFPYVKHGQA